MLPCEVLTIYLTILTCFYDLFPIETTIVYNLWNILYIPFIFTFRQGSKVAESGRNLMITIEIRINYYDNTDSNIFSASTYCSCVSSIKTSF